MKSAEEVKSFLAQVDSIQSRFLESLFTGQRDVLFKKAEAKRKPESEDDQNQVYIDSQRGTF
jgi:hypothetical protein